MPFHPRNRHQGHYDFEKLIQASPELAQFVAPTRFGDRSVDFANPQAVKALNRALLAHYYGVREWDVPEGYLCPPIPGRADYIHTVADLLNTKEKNIRGLDIGVGANCVYPIIGHGEYGWNFVAVETDTAALASVERILKANPNLASAVEIRKQPSKEQFFKGIMKPGEHFSFSICNPPFHASLEDAAAGSQRKWRGLGKSLKSGVAPKLNFGGQPEELWYPGGELTFVSRMIGESRSFAKNVVWFTALISRGRHLDAIEEALNHAKVKDYKILPMSQGQKNSRVVAWSFA